MGKDAKATMIFMVTTILALMRSSANAATVEAPSLAPSLAPSPAPAPAPAYVDLTHLFTVTGPFATFLNLLESTQVMETFQNQANNTEEGITIFVPQDKSFSSLKEQSLVNLTKEQLKSLLLFHALPKFYPLAAFRNLSETNPVTTFAGGQYTLNFTDVSGTPHIDSGWTKTKVSSSVYSTEPVSIYQVDRVLLPEAIYGTPPPPSPAPAPAPDFTPAPDGSPSASIGDGSSVRSPKSPSDSSSSDSSKGPLSSMIFAAAVVCMML